MRHLRQWKRILAALGSAAMLVSSVGAVQQTVYAVEQSPIENVSETEEDIEEDDQVEPEDLGDGASDSVVVGGKETDNEGDGRQESGDSDDEGTSGGSGAGAGTGSESGSGSDGAGAGSGSEGGSGAGAGSGAGDGSGSSESGNGSGAGDGSESGSGSEQGASGDGAGDAGTGSDGQTGDDSGTGNGTASGNPEGSVVNEDGSVTWPDGTVVAVDGTKTLPDGTVIAPDGTKTLPDGTVIKPEDEEPGDGSADGEDGEDVALADSLHVTLETAESEQTDPSMDEDGVYLYTQGETATTTLTIANPDDHALSEDDGAVVRVYMQFKDAVPSDDETVPYKASLPEEGTVAALAMDLSEDERDIALIEELGGDASGDADDAGSAEDAEDEDDGSEETSAQSENGTDESGVSLASEDGVEGDDAGDGEQNANGSEGQSGDGSETRSGVDGKDKASRGETMAVGSYSVTADDGVSYGYTVAEVENGLYCYEFGRPINGAEYSVQLTSSYPEGCLGGTNTIWAIALSGDDKAALDTDGKTGVAERPESEDLQDVLRWGTAATVVSDGTTRTQETENYTVTVTYGEDSMIPTDAVLEVTEYATDSAIYQQITEETGETYDWLLDISFYYNDIELEPQAPISIQVKAKDESVVVNEDSITTITHFADTGTEVIENDDVEVAEDEDGLVCTSFELASLSLVAGTTYNTATVVKESAYAGNTGYNKDFLIYKVQGDYVYYLAVVSGNPTTFRVKLSDILKRTGTASESNMTSIGDVSYYANSIKGETVNNRGSWTTATLNWSNLVWHHNGSDRDADGSLRHMGTSGTRNYLQIYDGDLSLTSWNDVYSSQGSNQKYTRFSERFTEYFFLLPVGTTTYYLVFNGTRFTASESTSGSDLTLAQVGSYTEPDKGSTGVTGSKDAVYTGDINDSSLKFYSVCIKTEDGSDTLAALPGVTYTFYTVNADGSLGDVAATYVTSDSIVVKLDEVGLAKGKSYAMKMTSVPEGYLCDSDTWTFEYKEGQKVLNMKNGKNESEGIIVINPYDNMTMDKTATVADIRDATYSYINRLYKINLNAHSDLKVASIEGLKIDFIVDQSNSMLFPSGLKAVPGKTLAFLQMTSKNSKGNYNWQAESSGLEALEKLDKNQVYYIVVAKETSATVMAIFYNEGADHNGMWCYQDAGEYAIACHTQDANKIKIVTERSQYFPTGDYEDTKMGGAFMYYDKSNSKYVKYNMGGSIVLDLREMYPSYNDNNRNRVEYQVYTATNQYNRLHYLEQSLCDLLQMLAAMYPETEVTLDKFTSEFKGHVVDKKLDDQGLQELLTAVENITTDGGTRQDKALQQSWNDHIQYYKTGGNNYVVLITDGAPAGQSTAKLGTATDKVGTGDTGDDDLSSNNTVYMNLNYWAKEIQKKATLVTIGLSMDDVISGKKAMQHISTDGPSVSNADTSKEFGPWWFQPKDTADLIDILTNKLFNKIVKTKSQSPDSGTVVDYISDSYYPVDQNGNAVTVGTRINKNGDVVTYGGNGTIKQDTDGSWYVEWDPTEIAASNTAKFEGSVYVKAKEDFIGGNGIDTNKKATLSLTSGMDLEYETPNVNVRLLDMTKHDTEVTVFKGDLINGTSSTYQTPGDSMTYLYSQVEVEKIRKNSTGDVYNKVGKGESDGLKADSFTLDYAIGALTDAQWADLKKGNAVNVEYTYNEADGAVGFLTFELSNIGRDNVGTTADQTDRYASHTAETASTKDADNNLQPVETYTLKVTYTAYSLSQRNKENKHNGEEYNDQGVQTKPGKPGTEVGSSNTTTLENGLGTYSKENVHRVYVIDGTIRISKVIENNLVSNKDQTYTFTLQRLSADGTTYENYPATNPTRTITVKAGKTTGETTAEWTSLPRGTYIVKEMVNADSAHAVKQITVDTNQTNCYYSTNLSTETSGKLNDPNNPSTVTFHMGYNKGSVDDVDVIGKANTTDLYTSYIHSPNGVLGVAEFTNTLNKYELPETGGSGTLPLQAAGAAMVLAACAGVYVTRRRRYGR